MLAQVFDLFHVIALFFQMQLGIVKEQMQLVIFATADARHHSTSKVLIGQYHIHML